MGVNTLPNFLLGSEVNPNGAWYSGAGVMPVDGSRLRALRESSHMTQQEVADAVGVTPEAIGNYEGDKREPKGDILVKLARVFGVSTDYLLGRTDVRLSGRVAENTADYGSGESAELPPDLIEAINSLPEESRRVFLRAKNLSPEGLRSVVDYIRFKLGQESEERPHSK